MKRLPRRLRHAEAPLAVPTLRTRELLARPSALNDRCARISSTPA